MIRTLSLPPENLSACTGTVHVFNSSIRMSCESEIEDHSARQHANHLLCAAFTASLLILQAHGATCNRERARRPDSTASAAGTAYAAREGVWARSGARPLSFGICPKPAARNGDAVPREGGARWCDWGGCHGGRQPCPQAHLGVLGIPTSRAPQAHRSLSGEHSSP